LSRHSTRTIGSQKSLNRSTKIWRRHYALSVRLLDLTANPRPI